MLQYQLANVSKTYETPSGVLHILNNINLTITKGDSVAITGASGSGKSTLLHILGMLDSPTSGNLIFNGTDMLSMTEKEKASFRNKNLGFVFQFHNLLPEFSAVENTAMQGLIAGMKKTKALALAKEVLEHVGLADKAQHKITTLSGGERQRVAIARAILLKPPILLADEPTGSLDQKTGEDVAQLLLMLNQTLSMALIVVTHNTNIACSMKRCLNLRSGVLS